LAWLSDQPVGIDLDPNDNRLIVRSVKADGMAARAGLREGDILAQIDSLEAPSPAQAAAYFRNALATGKSAIVLIVSRGGRELYLALRLRP
jgi:C-terminal processing protease CtpA/Prc